jgi:hypothetical protein
MDRWNPARWNLFVWLPLEGRVVRPYEWTARSRKYKSDGYLYFFVETAAFGGGGGGCVSNN